MKENLLTLNLWKEENEINVTANILLKHENNPSFEFILAKDFLIDKVVCDNKQLNVTSISEPLPFRAMTNRYTVDISSLRSSLAHTIAIMYHGNAKSWHTLYEEDILAINMYTAWYPDECIPAMKDILVKIHMNDEYYIVNGSYHATKGIWHYKPLDFDVNILAMKNYEVYQNSSVAVYYYGKENNDVARLYYDSYIKCSKYYKQLYGNDKTTNTNIVILPTKNNDGYMRRSLMVLGGFGDDVADIVHHIAHETAHCWCTGAEAATWEDWMNETFAEWSALLFELEVMDNQEKFNQVIEDKQTIYSTLPPIKTPDGKRPEGVHHKGVYMLNDIFLQYGANGIKEILLAFDRLEKKSTQGLLDELIKKSETFEISNYILGHL